VEVTERGKGRKRNKMKRAYHIRFIAVLISCLLISASSHAAIDTVSGYYGYNATSGIQEFYGQYVNAESYSRLGTVEDYDPGYLEDFWGLHLRSETEVLNSQGRVAADSQTTASVGAWEGVGQASLELNESIDALAWANTQSYYSPDIARTVDVSFYTSSGFNLPVGLVGSVNYYFGLWENDKTVDNFMLTEKDGWTLADLDYQGQNYTLLKRSYTLDYGVLEDTTAWSLDLDIGNNYNYFAYMVADVEIVPEPATMLLFGLGGLLLRKRRALL